MKSQKFTARAFGQRIGKRGGRFCLENASPASRVKLRTELSEGEARAAVKWGAMLNARVSVTPVNEKRKKA